MQNYQWHTHIPLHSWYNTSVLGQYLGIVVVYLSSNSKNEITLPSSIPKLYFIDTPPSPHQYTEMYFTCIYVCFVHLFQNTAFNFDRAAGLLVGRFFGLWNVKPICCQVHNMPLYICIEHFEF